MTDYVVYLTEYERNAAARALADTFRISPRDNQQNAADHAYYGLLDALPLKEAERLVGDAFERLAFGVEHGNGDLAEAALAALRPATSGGGGIASEPRHDVAKGSVGGNASAPDTDAPSPPGGDV